MTALPSSSTMDISTNEKTLSDRAWRLLRDDIRSARLPPDKRLRITELQDRYDLGISPLREALLRLVSEGLVVMEGQRGFAVASVSLSELEDLTRARIRLESAILQEAVERGGADWEAGMVSAFHLLSRTPLPTDEQDATAAALWEARHRAFHQSLVAGCQSPWLLRMQAQLAEHTERYRRVRLFHSVPPLQLARDVDSEHRDLMQALLDRDAERASQLLKAHLEYTAKAVASLWLAAEDVKAD